MLFLVIVMAAISVTVAYHAADTDIGPDPDVFLKEISVMEIRLSDLTEMDDDSLGYLSDLMAYSVTHDCGVQEYLEGLLGALFGKGRFLLEYSYGGHTVTIGEDRRYFRSESSRSIAVSVGGYMEAKLRVVR